MAKNKLPLADVTEAPHYHDTWTLLRKYRDVVWSLEVSVRQVRNRFRIDYGKTIEDFLESVYLAGADLSGTELEHQAKCIEQSHTVDTPTLCKLLCCGRYTAIQIGDLAHARIVTNSRVLWSVQRIKEYVYKISC